MIWGDPKCWSALFPMEAIMVLMDCVTWLGGALPGNKWPLFGLRRDQKTSYGRKP